MKNVTGALNETQSRGKKKKGGAPLPLLLATTEHMKGQENTKFNSRAAARRNYISERDSLLLPLPRHIKSSREKQKGKVFICSVCAWL